MYSNLERVAVDGGAGGDTIQVQGTAAAATSIDAGGSDLSQWPQKAELRTSANVESELWNPYRPLATGLRRFALCGAILLPIPLVLSANDPQPFDKSRYWGGVWGFGVVAALGTLFGVLARRHATELDELIARFRRGDVLARWSYTPKDWEASRAGRTNWLVDVVPALCAFWMAMCLLLWGVEVTVYPLFSATPPRQRDIGWPVLLAIVAGLVVVAGTLWWSRRLSRTTDPKPPDSYVARDGMGLDRKATKFRRGVRKVRIEPANNETGVPANLVIIEQGSGGRSRVGPEHRVPVPTGREDEARRIAQELGPVEE